MRPSRSMHVLLIGLSVACTKPYQIELRQGPSLAVEAIAFFPCHFRWEEPSYRSFEISQTLAMQTVATDRYSVFGPGELRVVRANIDNPFTGSDFLFSLTERNISPRAALIVRPSIERRVKSETKLVFDMKGAHKGTMRAEEVTIVASLEVYHSATGARIAEVTSKLEIDPFAAQEGADPMPEVTAIFTQMMAGLLDELSDRAPGNLLSNDSGFEYIWNPKAVLEFSLEGRPSLWQSLSRLDAMERDVAIQNRIRFFLPAMEQSNLSALSRLPGGLVVTGVGDAAKSGLVKGDVISMINTDPAMPQVLHRTLRARSDRSIYLRVYRKGTQLDLALVR